MAPMTTALRRPATPIAALLLAMLAACGSSQPAATTGEPVGAPSATAGIPAGPTATGPASATGGPSLTPVPGGSTPEPVDPGGGTTLTEWGRILDRVPGGFPVYPGAGPADGVTEPTSGAWVAAAGTARVADWYVAALEELGWSSIDLASPLEDGTQVLDLASDLPECRVQVTFRPAGESTMILVLYGAGCAGDDA
jgi:hypothetical protein